MEPSAPLREHQPPNGQPPILDELLVRLVALSRIAAAVVLGAATHISNSLAQSTSMPPT
jgi:hypothetical protein